MASTSTIENIPLRFKLPGLNLPLNWIPSGANTEQGEKKPLFWTALSNDNIMTGYTSYDF
jgi:hypothetical protein